MSITNGTSITVYEWDAYLNMETFHVSEVIAGTASFVTDYNETISLWSDGEYLTINCTRPYSDGNGCNLGGTQLNGIPGYPRGIWAWELVNYTLGIGGNESTVYEILYVLGKSTFGDGNSSATVGFLGTSVPSDLLSASLDGPYVAQLNETVTFTVLAPPPVWFYRWDVPADGLFDTAWILDLTGKNTIEHTLMSLVKTFVCVNVWDGLRPWNESHTECAPLEVLEKRPPRPPKDLSASLTGIDFESVFLNWTLSHDDGRPIVRVERYDIYRSESFASNGSGYVLYDSVPPGTSSYIDTMAGEGNPTDYFYRVCAFNSTNLSSYASGQAGKFTRPLTRGPQSVSIPLLQSNESIETVLQTVAYDKAWYYHSFSQEWKWYMKHKNYRRGLWNINHTMGLWVNVTRDSNLTVAGVVPTSTYIHLAAGWNLVGFPSFNSSYTISDLKADTRAVRVEGYDSMPPFYLGVLGDGEVIQAGWAYWVRVEADTVWTAVVS